MSPRRNDSATAAADHDRKETLAFSIPLVQSRTSRGTAAGFAPKPSTSYQQAPNESIVRSSRIGHSFISSESSFSYKLPREFVGERVTGGALDFLVDKRVALFRNSSHNCFDRDCAVAAVGYKDFYQILGVSKTATTKEIKEKYRKLARQYHPDINKNKDAEEKFKDISEAYEVLGDDEKRRKYDQFGQYWNSAGAGGGSGFGGFEGGQYASFEEFINELLGRFGGGAAGGARGARTRTRSAGGPGFDFSDFGFGRGGPGAAGGNPFAGGGGNPFAGAAGNPFAGAGGNPFGGGPSGGPSQEPATTVKLDLSSAFKGTSRVFRMPSPSGRDESVTLDIPAGVFPGSKVRFGGKGAVNPITGKKGDIMLNIELESHPFFRLTKQESGNPPKVSWRLECDVQVSPDEAVLGGEIPVMTPNGSLDVTVPAGVRSGQFLRLRGKGWPDVRGGERGDLYVRVLIVPPPKGGMSEREKELYQELAKARSWDPREGVSKYAL